MSTSIWHRKSCNPGRKYQLGTDIYIQFEDKQKIIDSILKQLEEFIIIEPAVRLLTDTHLCTPERAVISIPFKVNVHDLLENFARTIYQSVIGYYISSEPKTSHFGIANLTLQGKTNNLVKREMEKLFVMYQNRDDMTGLLLKDIKFKFQDVPPTGDTYLQETLRKGLDIHIGFRIMAYGKTVHPSYMFIPILEGSEIIDRIYYNLEHIIHQNFLSYDESGDKYLNVTDTLIFKELALVLSRAKTKENTRKKIINNLQFTTMFTDESKFLDSKFAGDQLYDTINNVFDEKLRDASIRSRELYTSCMVRSTEITTMEIKDVSKLSIENHKTYVPSRPQEVKSNKKNQKEKVMASSKSKNTSAKKQKKVDFSSKDDGFEEL